jgi:phage I-like protein
MKTKNTLNKNKIAILSATLNAAGDGWYQLLPAGEFKARDGRPFDVESGCWFLDENIATAFIQRTIDESKGKPILIDYDHQTLYKNENGQKAPAAGRIVNPSQDIQWRPDGIYIRPRWTPIAESEIASEQFNDLSAVFPYDDNGHPLYLRMAAITNDPALLEIKSLVALAAEFFNEDEQKEIKMNEALRRILVQLGVLSADDSTELNDENITEFANKAAEKLNALIEASKAAVDVSNALESATTTESAITEIVDVVDSSLSEIEEAEIIVEEAALNGIDLRKAVPVSAYQRLSARYAALSASAGDSSISELLRQGRQRGQVTNANIGYLTAVGRKHGVAALSAAINAIPPITALSAKQTKAINKPVKQVGTAVLSASEKEAARLLGITEAEFQKRKKGAAK